MYSVRTLDTSEIYHFFSIARKDKHKKASIFTDDRCDNYLQFHLLEDDGDPIAMCGIYPFTEVLCRVSDRFYKFKKNTGLGINDRYWTDYFKPIQTKWCLENGYVPFHSCEGIRRRKAFEQIVSRNPEYVLLEDMYQTCKKDSRQCWQSISILKGYERYMTLPRRTVDDVFKTVGS